MLEANGVTLSIQLVDFPGKMEQKKQNKKTILLTKQIKIRLTNLNTNLNVENKLQYQNLQDQLNEIIENEVKGGVFVMIMKRVRNVQNKKLLAG